MLKKYTFFFVALFLLLFKVEASSISGAQVTYRNIGSYKFEVSYKIYRDCRSIPIDAKAYKIRCASSGTTKNLTANLIYVKDISNSCSKGSYCSKPNQMNSGAEPIFEEFLYMDTLDFNGSESAFKSCCIIQIGAGFCCRNGAITTGAAGNDFWVYSTLDLCKAVSNSSPIFKFKPNLIATANEPLLTSYYAKDSIDGDSLSYSFIDPMTSWTGKATWGSNFDAKNPITAYYPINYNRANGPNPNANPAVGVYLNPLTGQLITVPVNASEYATIAVSVKEWRKDSKGKYEQIGEIVIDHSLVVANFLNHTPRISGKLSYNVCEGQKFSLEILTDDNPFNLPPPNSPILNDTLSFVWDKGIKGATYTIKNSAAKLPEGVFEWTPATGDSKNIPFEFSVMSSDNNCNSNSVTIKTFQLKVYPKISVSSTIKKINNATYSVNLGIDNKKYTYLTSKYIKSDIGFEDSRNYTFKSSKNLISDLESDTIVFKKNGTYVLYQSFLSQTDCNSTILTDTIKVTNVMEVNLGMTPLGHYPDTSVCKNQMTRLVAKVNNATNPVTFTWRLGKTTTTNTLGYFDFAYSKTDTLFLSIKDNNNQINSTFKIINVLEIPEINGGKDQTICPDNRIILKAKSLKIDNLTWAWIKDSKVISNGDSVATSAKGIYEVSATNVKGCTVSDSVIISHFNPIKIDLISGKYCQDKNGLVQAEILKGNVNQNFDVINWKLIKSLPKLTGGNNVLSDLLTDKNPSAGFDFFISFDDAKVALPSNKDSLVFIVSAIDTNACFTSDTMTLTLLKKPNVSITKKPVDKCLNLTFSLDTFGSSSYTYAWLPYNASGFGKWPTLNPLVKGVIMANYFSIPAKYKAKLEAINEFCKTTDSLTFTILPLPRPVIGLLKYESAIRFRDESINKKSCKWYINNTFYSSADTILLSKSFVHLQPIKLEVTDNSGCINDTTIVINTQVGITPIQISKLTLYPNPSGQYIILKQPDYWVSTPYEIYDAAGKMVCEGVTKSKEERIDLKDIKKGFYILKYLASTGSLSVHFIKSE